MDNQQGTIALAYLAGIIDGEGSVMAATHKDKNKMWVVMEMKIANTNFELIEHIASILSTFGIAYYIATRNGSKPKHKTAKVISVSGLKRLHKFLPLVIPYLVAKKQQAKTALKYIESRLSNTSRKAPFTKDEIGMLDVIKILNRRGNGHLNDYTSPFSELRLKKI